MFDLEFKGSWRSYQKRVLDELEYLLDDNKLNIVAAPGAGKTILGIEVLSRLRQNTLILAPTITIKNQWVQRIVDNFINNESDINKISNDISVIKDITVSTYQGLHSLYKNKDDKERLIQDLKKKEINTLVLDEAHHLRTEWWSTLNALYSELDNKKLKIVSLTGTPPYDVSPSEWSNYHSLCGPVDAEISIPELVKAGDLCPHQDLIYFSDLTKEEKNIVFDFNERLKEFLTFIDETSDLFYAIESSRFINELDNNVDIIYEDTNFTVSLISYLLSVDSMNMNARILTEFIGLSLKQIPKFDNLSAQFLINGILGRFSDYFKNVPLLKSKLKDLKLLKGNKVDFTGKTDFKNLFARSLNKLDAIFEITKFEYFIQKEALREVILLDYIGKGNLEGLNIFSTFEKLYSLHLNIGVLTGSLVVIPIEAKDELYKILDSQNIHKTKILTTEFEPGYVRVESFGNIDLVSIITKLFEKGFINILIGTAALLGEGWDSPSVNTLVIASIVGSFMLSNQMRGRALRIDKNNKFKTSNIWHLVSLCGNYEQAPDFLTIEKRFNTFEGISYNANKIQNGIERLNLNMNDIRSIDCKNLNREIFEYAKARTHLKDRWQQIFDGSCINEKNMAPQIYDVILGGQTQKNIVYSDIPKWFVGFNTILKNIGVCRKSFKMNFIEKAFLRICKKMNFVMDNYEQVIQENYFIYQKQNLLESFAKSLLLTMCDLSFIKTDFSKINLYFNTELNSNFYITLSGCTNYERNLFIKSFGEIFDLNDKNRYILKFDEYYYAVPECIASHNKNVKLFVKHLEQYLIGYFEIIYTRNPNGYKELLKARYTKPKYDKLKNSRVWI
ncbi:DEAD/DEAH box helicase family protein [bacterium]|nr:DEAD/DEAH box helicase family protein [bacterium]